MKLFQYKELQTVTADRFATSTDYMVEVVSIATDQDPDTLLDLPIDELQTMFKAVQLQLKPRKPKDIIVVDGVTLYKKPFNTMTIGEYIDLSNLLIAEKNFEVLPMFYRVATPDQFGIPIFEPYTNEVLKRANAFGNVDAGDVLGVISDAIHWRDNFITTYRPLFDVDTGEDEPENEQQGIEIAKAKQTEKAQKAYIWEAFLMKLAGDDITKVEAVLDQSVILAFNILSMKKALNQ